MHLITTLLIIIGYYCRFSVTFKPYHDPNFHINRTGIVQLFEWPFKAITRECETFLGPKGFAGIQVSPIHENRIIDDRPWYERYQPISYKIISRSGDENDFIDMVKRCNNAGIRTYVDVILNHMSGDGDRDIVVGVGGSLAMPKSRSYFDIPYTIDDFNTECQIKDHENRAELRNCETAGLHDLNQTKPHVQQQIKTFMNKLIDFGVAGFRIGAASNMWPKDLAAIFTKLSNLNTEFKFKSNSRPYIYQDATTFKNDYIDLGSIAESKYSYFITEAFRGNFKIKNYADIGPKWDLVDSTNALVFIDNHDTQRAYKPLTHKEPALYIMGTAFMLAHPYGVKRVMSSYNFTDNKSGPPQDNDFNIIDPLPNINGKCTKNWQCEHRWRGIPEMIQFANIVAGTELKNYWANDDGQAGFCRGDKGFIAFNTGNKDMSVTLDVCVAPGRYCDITTGITKQATTSFSQTKCSGREIIVDNDRKAKITILSTDKRKYVAIHVKSKI